LVAEFALGVHHRDLHRAPGEGIRQDRDKGAALMAVEHGVDDMAAVGAQHAAVVAHRFTGGALDQAVDHLRRAFAEDAVLTVLAHGAHHVVAFIRLRHQARDLFRRVLQVGIKGNNQIAGHMAEAGHDRRVLAVVTVNSTATTWLPSASAASVSMRAESSLLPSSTSRISYCRPSVAQAVSVRRISSGRLSCSL
jgi:hypothetical protein